MYSTAIRISFVPKKMWANERICCWGEVVRRIGRVHAICVQCYLFSYALYMLFNVQTACSIIGMYVHQMCWSAYLCSSQCRHIEYNGSFQYFLWISNTICQHQTTLSICIVDFYRSSGVQLMNIVRTVDLLNRVFGNEEREWESEGERETLKTRKFNGQNQI